MQSEPQDMVVALDVLTSELPCRSESMLSAFGLREVLFNELTQEKSTSWRHVPMIVEKRFKISKPKANEKLDKYTDLAIANVARLASLNAIFHFWTKKYLYVVIYHFDGTYNYLTHL